MPELLEKQVAYSAADVTLVTTAETVIISSGPVKVPAQTCLVHVRAYAQMEAGAGTSYVGPQIRRGNSVSGLLISELQWEALKTAPGSVESFVMEVIERRSDQDTVEYSLTLTQANAIANGTVFQAVIEVEILSG